MKRSVLLAVLLALAAASAHCAGKTVFNVRDFGAKGDGVRLDTEAIQAAVDTCAKRGGTVEFPAGRYLTGTLRLKSNVTLHLAASATILGSTDLKDYATDIVGCAYTNETHINKCLIYAENAENIAITGQGAIDGQGGSFPSATADGKRADRPMLIRFVKCLSVLLEDVRLGSAASWCTNLVSCRGVKVRGISIHNRVNANNDGIDLTNSSNVCISDSTFICQDDAICLQSMSDEDPVKDIVITNCIFSTRWAAIRTGGANRGGIRNVAVSNCVIYDTFGCGIKLQVSGNCTMENMSFTNLVMNNVSSPVSLRFGNCHYNGEKRDESHPWGGMRNISFSHIRASVPDEARLKRDNPDAYPGEERQCISVCGIPDHPVENVSFSDIQVTFPGGGTKDEAAKRDMPELADQYPEYFMWGVLPAYGLYARHVRGLSLDNVRFDLASTDLRPAVILDDAADIDVRGFRARGFAGAESLLRFRSTRDAFVQGCRTLGEIAAFLRVEGKDSRGVVLSGNDASGVGARVETTDGAEPSAISSRTQ